MTIGERIEVRLGESLESDLLDEITTTACDRILMRAGIEVYDAEGARTTFPPALGTIAVEVAVKIYRRMNFEGISAESIGAGSDALNTSFVDDILSEYTEEIKAYKRNTTRVVTFL